jgi:hypothetical protein
MLLGTITIPYGFTSPLAGSVEPSLLTLVNLARKGPELGADWAGALALAAELELELDELLVLLELPQPANTSATPARARIDSLGTRCLLWFGNRTRRFLDYSPSFDRESRDP